MAVADQPRRNDHLGDGSTVAFPYTFRILTKQGLRNLVSGVALVVDTDYAVSGVGDSAGGTITFVSAPAAGATVTFLGDQDFDQPSVYAVNEAFPATRVEKDFDKALMRAQQLREVQTRQLTYPENEAGSALANTLPTVADRTNKLLGFDASGNPIATLGSEAAIASAAAAAASASAVAAASSETAATAASSSATSSALAANASAVAAATSATTLQGNSTTSVAIATGNTVFTTQAGKQFTAGEWILITADADPTNYLHGQVTSYSGTGLIVNVTDTGGSGTFANWTITVAGTRGSLGPVGPTGPTGGLPIAVAGGTVDVITANFTPDLTLTDQMTCMVVGLGANTIAGVTFAPDGLTARAVVKKGGVALAPEDIGAAGFVMLLEYNLANTRWELLNPAAKPRLKVFTFAYDTATASGTQTITGIGFTPRLFLFDGAVPDATGASFYGGKDDGTSHSCIFSRDGVFSFRSSTSITHSLVFMTTSDTDFTAGLISSFNSDGGVITWTKTGAPTGVAQINGVAFE